MFANIRKLVSLYYENNNNIQIFMEHTVSQRTVGMHYTYIYEH